MNRGDCSICGSPVTALQEAAWPVSGWEPERCKGANQILHRKREPGRIAHLVCVKYRDTRDQGSLDMGSAA